MVGNILGKLRTVFQPGKPNEGCHKREIGDLGGKSQGEVKKYRADNVEAFNAKQRPYQAALRAAARSKRYEAARDWLKEKGHGDALLDPVELEAELQRILNQCLAEFGNRSVWDLMHDKNTDFVRNSALQRS